MRFTATLEQSGRTATGIRIPPEVLEAIGKGTHPPLVVAFPNGFRHRTTAGSHDGGTYIPVSADVRAQAGIASGDVVDLDVVHDADPRPVDVPDDLATALADHPSAKAFFEGLTDSQRKGFVVSVTSAKQAETRARRVERAIAALAEGQKRP